MTSKNRPRPPPRHRPRGLCIIVCVVRAMQNGGSVLHMLRTHIVHAKLTAISFITMSRPTSYTLRLCQQSDLWHIACRRHHPVPHPCLGLQHLFETPGPMGRKGETSGPIGRRAPQGREKKTAELSKPRCARLFPGGFSID